GLQIHLPRMRLSHRLIGGERRGPPGKHGHERDHTCDQPLEQHHCRLLSSTRKPALRIKAPFAVHRRTDVRPEPPLSTALCHGRGSLNGASGGEIPASQTTIPTLPQCAKLRPPQG